MTTKILREARLILPLATNEAHLQVHKALTASIVDLAGGATVIPNGGGAWRHPDGHDCVEDVMIYDVAITEDQNADLIQILLDAGRKLGEHSVYYRNSDGVVSIIECGINAGDDEPGKTQAPYAGPGEVWKTRDGSIVALVRYSGTGKQRVVAVVLKSGGLIAVTAGGTTSYTCRFNGRYTEEGKNHPLDLVECIAMF